MIISTESTIIFQMNNDGKGTILLFMANMSEGFDHSSMNQQDERFYHYFNRKLKSLLVNNNSGDISNN